MRKPNKKPLSTAIYTALCAAALLAQTAQAAQTCNDKVDATTPTSRFTINADNTVTDKATGLTWMRCTLGQTGSDCSGGAAKKYTWVAALNEVAQKHSGWRAPNIKELASIAELKCYGPAINTTVFPNTVSSGYWSSSPFAISNSSAWGVDFYNGGDPNYAKYPSYYVRLVRSGQ